MNVIVTVVRTVLTIVGQDSYAMDILMRIVAKIRKEVFVVTIACRDFGLTP